MDVTKPSPGDTPGGPGARRPIAIAGLRRDDRFARRVALAWRRLTAGGAKTLIACSGGADSTALLLALTLATRDLAVAHVVHDLRPRADAEADRDAVRALAAQLDLPFVESEVKVAKSPGNMESNARRERYHALAELARTHRCPFIATAHHADDQLETLLMALLRGSGPRGLRGIAPMRALKSSSPGPTGGGVRVFEDGGGLSAGAPSRPITLIRPMLHVTRAEARAACIDAGIAWREDATNTDTSRLRAALRADILPAIIALRAESPRRAARAAELLRDACSTIDERVNAVFGDAFAWGRSELRPHSPLILGTGLRRAAVRLLKARLSDRLSSRLVDAAVRAIRDQSTEPREFHWPGGVTVRVTARRVDATILGVDSV